MLKYSIFEKCKNAFKHATPNSTLYKVANVLYTFS